MARCRIGAGEGEGDGTTGGVGALEMCVPREDHPEQEDHRTHHREPLPMQPDTEIQCNIMKCIMRIMHISV
jgi:hypothetical protein